MLFCPPQHGSPKGEDQWLCSRLGIGSPENTSGNGDISPLHLPEPVSKAGLIFGLVILVNISYLT